MTLEVGFFVVVVADADAVGADGFEHIDAGVAADGVDVFEFLRLLLVEQV